MTANNPLAGLMTTNEFAEAIGCTRQCLMTWKAEGRATPVAIVGSHPTAPLFWDPADVELLRQSYGVRR